VFRVRFVLDLLKFTNKVRDPSLSRKLREEIENWKARIRIGHQLDDWDCFRSLTFRGANIVGEHINPTMGFSVKVMLLPVR